MKNKLKTIIPIAIAVIAIIIAALVIRFNGGGSVDIRSMMSTAQKYLVENNYEQAIMEYEAIINLEPNNAEAYLGIAEAYVGMGDTGKAIEWLEKGYELTGDERLKNMIGELTDSVNAGLSDTSESSAATAETTETEETTQTEPVLTEKRLEYCDGWYSVFSYDESENIVSMILYNKSGEERMNAEYEYSGDDVHRKVYVDGALRDEGEVIFTDIMADAEKERRERANTRKEEDNNWWVYDENGDCIEHGWNNLDENGNATYDSGEEYYFKNGKIYKYHEHTYDHSLEWWVTTYYDDNGYAQRQEYANGDNIAYTYQYDDMGYPVIQYVDGNKFEEYTNFYTDDNKLEYAFALYKNEYYDIHFITDGRSESASMEVNGNGQYLRFISHYVNKADSNKDFTQVTYCIPSYDGTKMIDCLLIDDTLLFDCPYCNAE